MTRAALETRYRYIDESLARASEWLQDPGVRQILGADALASIELSMSRLYVPNLGRVGTWYVALETPTAYIDDTSLPVMAGFPGDRFIPDGPMMRQTAVQRERSLTRLGELYGDMAHATHVVEGRDARLLGQSNKTKVFHVSRYDADASTHMARGRIGPKGQEHAMIGRPFTLFTMGDMDEGYTVASPAATIHEFLHTDDFIGWGCVAVSALRTHRLSSELHAFHYGSRIERHATDTGLVRPDEWGDYNRVPGVPTYSERFEAVRASYATPDQPFAVTDTIEQALIAEGMW